MLGIESIPVCYMVKNGEMIDQMMGVPKKPEMLDSFIEKGIKAPNTFKDFNPDE